MKLHPIIITVSLLYFCIKNTNSETSTDIKISIEPLICQHEANEINLKDTCSTNTDIFNELNCISLVNNLRSAILQNYTGYKVAETLEG